MDKSLEARLQRIEDELKEHEDWHNSTLDIIGKIGPCFTALKSVVDENVAQIANLENRVEYLESE